MKSKEYREIAFEKYKMFPICEKCGNDKGKICIHHIDENRENNRRDNLKVLCQSCHVSHHYKNNKYALGIKHTAKANKEKSDRMKGENHPFYGKSHSSETKEKISKKLKGRVLPVSVREKMKGRTPWNKGKVNVYSKEALLKMRNAKLTQ